MPLTTENNDKKFCKREKIANVQKGFSDIQIKTGCVPKISLNIENYCFSLE